MLENITEWELAFILSLQGLGAWPVGLMNLFTFMGNREFYLLIMPALYWCWDSRLGLRVGLIFLLSASLATLLKLMTLTPRPYWFDPRIRLLSSAESSFGIPSAHAQNAVITWGALAAYGGSRWAWGLALFLSFMIGLSRIWLGVHYPVDVLAGWLLGGLLLLLLLRLERPVVAWFSRCNTPLQLALVFALSLVLILLAVWIRSQLYATWQFPPQWLENAAVYGLDEPLDPLALDDIISSAASFFGLAAGAILLGYEPDMAGPWRKRLNRYLIGVVGVLIFWQGLDLIFNLLASEGTLAAYLFRYIRYSLVGVWISALSPLLFVRVGLLPPREKALETIPNL